MLQVNECMASRARGLTVKDIQEYLELSTPQSIYHWFDGRNLPTLDNPYALSELFEVPLDLLVCGNREYDGNNNMNKLHARIIEYSRIKKNVA